MAISPFTYCERKPDIKRRKKENANYKKGNEIRISLNDIKEVKIIKVILQKKDITTGNPYKKHKKIILPIYGKENTTAFLKAISKAQVTRHKI